MEVDVLALHFGNPPEPGKASTCSRAVFGGVHGSHAWFVGAQGIYILLAWLLFVSGMSSICLNVLSGRLFEKVSMTHLDALAASFKLNWLNSREQHPTPLLCIFLQVGYFVAWVLCGYGPHTFDRGS